MGLKKQIFEKVQRILDLVEGEDRAVKGLEREIEHLREENKELRDRFMARNFEEYRIYEPARYESEMDQLALPEDADDANAGEILEIEQ
uniref:Uncharacterized protein n=1 Tax=viral metagenome TaxID=1070528 RepID=A0A6M3LPT1_9ZZZZ